MNKHFIEIDKKKIEVLEYPAPNKRKIIYIGGWVQVFDENEKFLRELNENFHIYIIHFPGYSGSEILKYRKIEFLADIVLKVVESIQIVDFDILAYSMGSQIVVQFNKKYKFTGKNILIGSSMISYSHGVSWYERLIINSKVLQWVIDKIPTIKKKIVSKAYGKISNYKDFGFEKVNLDGAYYSLMALLRSDFIDPLELDNVEFIFGENEGYLDQARKRNVEFQTIEGVGHYPFSKNWKETVDKIVKLLK